MTALTDLQITKLCAEAMKYRFVETYGCPEGVSMTYLDRHGAKHYYWRPLTDDAQAMALVKKFDMVVEREKDKSFGITIFGNERKGGHPTFVVRNQLDLNRAICECVAKMQAAKK
jgi:hypothetical protein